MSDEKPKYRRGRRRQDPPPKFFRACLTTRAGEGCGHLWEVPKGSTEASNCPECGHRGVFVCSADRYDGRCLAMVTRAGRRCKCHGGAVLVGRDAAMYRHGRSSKYMPAGWLAAYQESLDDENATTMRDAIAVHDSLIAEALKRAQSSESDSAWMAFEEAVADLQDALATNDQDRLGEITAVVLPDLLGQVKRERLARMEVGKLLADRAPMVSAHARAVQAAKVYMPMKEVTALMVAFADVVQRRVQDPRAVSDILRDLREMADRAAIEQDAAAN